MSDAVKRGTIMLLTPWAAQIIFFGCVGALIGMATGGVLYIFVGKII